MSALQDQLRHPELLVVFGTTPLEEADFDRKALALVQALHQLNRLRELAAYLQGALQSKDREDVFNWRAYLYKLLCSFDENVYKEVKSQAADREREACAILRSAKSSRRRSAIDSIGLQDPAVQELRRLPAFEALIRDGILNASTVSEKLVRLLGEFDSARRLEEACVYLHDVLRDVDRRRIIDWASYVYVTLRNYDEDMYEQRGGSCHSSVTMPSRQMADPGSIGFCEGEELYQEARQEDPAALASACLRLAVDRSSGSTAAQETAESASLGTDVQPLFAPAAGPASKPEQLEDGQGCGQSAVAGCPLVDSTSACHRSDVQERYIEGLAEFLEEVVLSQYADAVQAWCDDMGAISLEELAENVELLEASLPTLRPLERKRLLKGAASYLARAQKET
eukprot:TRINITY_DN31832_c0_g2_i1.p1 TRINITY_DN31832_c0_g2~~TRINITY_DN31832_c0_g2_i1.p1  ORF type:complete len:397 (+),score=64.79 TRINITY_DN31832_c0_g2_i1:137-1327(+)